MGPKKSKKAAKIVEERAFLKSTEEIPADVLGSYTGMTDDGEKPVQDADDL